MVAGGAWCTHTRTHTQAVVAVAIGYSSEVVPERLVENRKPLKLLDHMSLSTLEDLPPKSCFNLDTARVLRGVNLNAAAAAAAAIRNRFIRIMHRMQLSQREAGDVAFIFAFLLRHL